MRRAAGNAVTRIREAIVARSSPWVRRALGPAAKRLDALVIDHGLLRLAYDNGHRLSPEAWRAAQPSPERLRRWLGLGIRTVVNLRGRHRSGAYWLEREACEALGLTLVDFRLRSHEAPSRDQLHRARAILEEVEYPILMHCKSGADRTGLMAALYRVVREGAPVSEARAELSPRFGHWSWTATGILDSFLDRYLVDTAPHPMAFFEWVDRVYDRDALTRAFRARSWRARWRGSA
ncbi:MAG: tyrosine-protein phosphatase [Gemmatimonadales bacterium]